MPSGLLIDPVGQTVVVTVTSAGAGATVPIYSDINAVNSAANPLTITSPTVIWVKGTVNALISLKISGVERATSSGAALPFTFEDGSVGSTAPVSASVPFPVSGVVVPTGWGSFIAPKLAAAKAGTALASVAVVGDSISQGLFTSDPYTKAWPALFAADLQAKYGSGGSGFAGVNLARGAFTEEGNNTKLNGYATGLLVDAAATWTTFDGAASTSVPSLYQCGVCSNFPGLGSFGMCDGPGATLICNTTNHNTAGAYNTGTLTFNRVRGTTVKVAYNNNSAQAFTVKVDGTTVGTVTPTSTATVAVATFTGQTNASHTVVITPSAAGLVAIYGVWGTNASGVVVNNYSRWGFSSGAFAPDVTTYGHPSDWSGGSSDPFPCDLLIYSMGLNDYFYQVPPQLFGRNMTRALRAIKGGTAKAGALDVLVVMNHQGSFASGDDYGAYVALAQDIAANFGAAYVDLWTIYRNNYTYAQPLNFFGDGTADGLPGTAIHPGDTGHALSYAAIKSNVLTPAGLV